MYPVITECPVCSGELLITTLECRECDSSIKGRFISGPFGGLSPEQINFVELFVLSEGKINRMEEKLELSYPTIRNRLHEVIRALGYEPGLDDFQGLTEEEHKQILEDLDHGKINYQEAIELLKESEAK